MKRRWLAAFGTLAVVWTLTAQTRDTFKARLSPVPVDERLVSTITGHGSVSAVLSGTKLSLNGSFEGMRSPATAAHLYQSKMTGIRGVAIGDVDVSKAMDGNISASVDLTSAQVEALRKGLLYVMVHSTGAPDGNLWGWLLK